MKDVDKTTLVLIFGSYIAVFGYLAFLTWEALK